VAKDQSKKDKKEKKYKDPPRNMQYCEITHKLVGEEVYQKGFECQCYPCTMHRENNSVATQDDLRTPNPLFPDEKVRLRDKYGEVKIPIEIELRTKNNIKRKWVKFTDEMKMQYIHLLAKYGNKSKAAMALGISPSTTRKAKRDDEEFSEAVDVAMEIYRDTLEETITDRAVHGWDEPVFSQRLGTQIGTIKRFDNRLLELLAKRHIPAFREKQQLDVQIGGGVLLIPQKTDTPEKWEQKHKDLEGARHVDIDVGDTKDVGTQGGEDGQQNEVGDQT